MKVKNSQSFLSLYYEPGAVEVATGQLRGDMNVETWDRNTKSLGQVETPRPVAELMARWVMSTKPAATFLSTSLMRNALKLSIPALPWLLETAHFDDIQVRDSQGRQTNPRAQARHALERLSLIPAVSEAVQRLPLVVDIGAWPPTPKQVLPRLP